MNDMKKIKYFISPLIGCITLFFLGCEDPKLKQPRQTTLDQSQETSNSSGKVDREFTRELAREFAAEFVKEFAKQINHKGISLDANQSTGAFKNSVSKIGLVDASGKPHPLLSHCSEDVLEFYQKNADCFSILSPEQMPNYLEWQDGSSDKEFSSTNAKRGGPFMHICVISPGPLEQLAPMRMVHSAVIF